MLKIKKLLPFLLIAAVMFSCVPARQFEELKSKSANCEEERETLKSENKDLSVKNTELTAELKELKKQIKGLTNDTTVIGITLRKLTKQYGKINNLNDELLDKQKDLLFGNQQETAKLAAELQATQLRLQKKEDELRKLERDLNEKKRNIEEQERNIKEQENALMAKNKRLAELESILSRKDSIVNALKDKVSAALLGYEGKGLTIEQKNGKVYVSLDEKLLFKSGSSSVDPKGVKALKDLAGVLEINPDINVMIEGHTDDVGKVDYNWGLSVDRATSIVKILMDNSTIDPTRLTASGRGPHMPVDPAATKEARQKNRRTEIILTPKLDELFEILNFN